MITRGDIKEILDRYKSTTIATICSHTALQIFHGAREEGFKTLGICKPELRGFYESFPLAKPDVFVEVEDYSEVLDDAIQKKLRIENAVVIPHGSFVEYVGAENILEKFSVPMFGNREVLEWESDRKKEGRWLNAAGIRMPLVFKKPSDIDRLVMVKFPGAKGGKSYFLARNEDEFHQGIEESGMKGGEYMIQEYVIGTRFYPHYFYSPLTGNTEFLSVDVRYESNIDGMVRVPHIMDNLDPTFVVTGNIPVVVRESLIPKIRDMGSSVVESSEQLFPPGINGPFCIETICTDNLEFVAFEISARIVAGTNLYIHGSPYSQLLYREPMSTGRRISREIKMAMEGGLLERIIY
ncbi:MAG: formate--phosphoribosylaminoimidazolecarboxamide ligase [Candidatus Altiarchaeota archaeon]|nr:formate--phosphoribosylaminoimidazolecarboxamide ligase [Candidatus Altiarchaeota archaeon]